MFGSWVPPSRRFWESDAMFISRVPSSRRFWGRFAIFGSWVPSTRRLRGRPTRPVSRVPPPRILSGLLAKSRESTAPESRLLGSLSRAIRCFRSSGVAVFRRFAARIFLFLARRLVRSDLDAPGDSGPSSLIIGVDGGGPGTLTKQARNGLASQENGVGVRTFHPNRRILRLQHSRLSSILCSNLPGRSRAPL